MRRPVSSASFCNSTFHNRRRAPLLPPESAVISSLPPHGLPPAAYTLDGELGGVMVHPNVHPTSVAADIVDPIGSGAPELLVQEVMHPHLLRIAFGSQFPPTILEIAYQLLLFRVHRNHGVLAGQIALHPSIHMFKLSVAIRMVRAFRGLPVGLQAVPQLMQ